MISGAFSILAGGASTITNSGTITGTNGTAISLSAAADTLTLLPGSQIFGAINMGGGADVVNVVGGGGVASVVALRNFTGTVNTRGLAVYNSTTQQVATLDGTAFAQADRGLMDIAGGASSLVSGRLNNISSSANGMMAMAYAPDESNPRNANAKMFTKAPVAQWSDAPYVVWTNGFGGQRTQDATDQTLHSTSTAYGGAIGIDRRVRPNWLLGAFAGGGAGNLSVDSNVQKVDSDYGFGGGYSRFEWGSQFLDVTVQAGSIHNKSTRQVADNIAGLAIATASYNGWFVSPEVAYGYRINMGNGITLTPTARLRYVAGMFDGYNEAGSAQNLSVGSRTLAGLRGARRAGSVAADGCRRAEQRAQGQRPWRHHRAAAGRRHHRQHRLDRPELRLCRTGQEQRSRRRAGLRLRLSGRRQCRAVCGGRRHRDVGPEPHRHRQGRRACGVLRNGWRSKQDLRVARSAVMLALDFCVACPTTASHAGSSVQPGQADT